MKSKKSSSKSVVVGASHPLKRVVKARESLTARKAARRSAKIPAKKSVADEKTRNVIGDWLQLGLLRSEKCELKEAQIAYTMALRDAKRVGEIRGVMESLSGLLRLARETMDEGAVERWEAELDEMMRAHPVQIPAMAWLCKAGIARHRGKIRQAQRYVHRYIRAVRHNPKSASYNGTLSLEEALAKGWVTMATLMVDRGKLRTASWLAEEIVRRWGPYRYRTVNGMAHLILAGVFKRQRNYDLAQLQLQKAHGVFLSEHNWFYYLWVLFGYAQNARCQQNYAQAYWYLDLVDKAVTAPEFSLIRREIAAERSRLEQDAVDLLIDSRRGVIKTRDGDEVSLGKQYVLLHILEALSSAHTRSGDDFNRGLSKAEIIQKVWKENYRPEAHDNKLYYNINRLRKLLEPDLRKPQYLLNWKEGYRLAPGLRIHFVGGTGAAGVAKFDQAGNEASIGSLSEGENHEVNA